VAFRRVAPQPSDELFQPILSVGGHATHAMHMQCACEWSSRGLFFGCCLLMEGSKCGLAPTIRCKARPAAPPSNRQATTSRGETSIQDVCCGSAQGETVAFECRKEHGSKCCVFGLGCDPQDWCVGGGGLAPTTHNHPAAVCCSQRPQFYTHGLRAQSGPRCSAATKRQRSGCVRT
jgi:hypothetical protein